MGLLQFTPVQILLGAMVAVLLLAAVGRVPLRYTLRNLTLRWKTTLMTAMAFTLVVALLTVMLAFVNGMYRLTAASGHPENVIVLSDGATDEVFSDLGPADIGDLENQSGVLRHGGLRLASREDYIVVTQPIAHPHPGRPNRRFLQVRGIDDPQVAAEVHGIPLFSGGACFSSAGVRELPDRRGEKGPGRAAIEVMLGDGIACELGRDRTEEEIAVARNPARLDVGDTFELNDRRWLIVGIMQSSGMTFDSEIWAKRSVVGPMFGEGGYTSLVVRTRDAQAAGRLKDFFTKDYKKAAVQAQVETEYFAGLAATSRQVLYAVGFVTLVMSVGGVFGVMNTMFAAISQRLKDIGVLRLIGFSRRQVLVSFLLESLLIALVGGLLGCALGCVCDGWTATSVVNSGPGSGKSVVLKLAVDSRILATGILVSLGMGGLGGLIPALSAMRLRPLEALR